VDIERLGIDGAFVITNEKHADDRGEFVEWFRSDIIQRETGLDFSTIQANLSVSTKGSFRGIHYADVPPGQAKYVTCVTGAILDFVVDIRVGSPTFGQWETVPISANDRRAVLLDVGLGHAFLALEENTTVAYLVTDHFKPKSEHAINPLDAELALSFPLSKRDLIFSPKDEKAPSLSEALDSGRLPQWKQAGK
jgi:dTDP-4-dehydrorhamnose 3,5-epimerase